MMIKRNKRDQRSYLLTAAGAMALVVLCSMTSSMHADQMPYGMPDEVVRKYDIAQQRYEVAQKQANAAEQALRKASNRLNEAIKKEVDDSEIALRKKEWNDARKHTAEALGDLFDATAEIEKDPRDIVRRYKSAQERVYDAEKRLNKARSEGAAKVVIDQLLGDQYNARVDEVMLEKAVEKIRKAGVAMEEIGGLE